MYHVGANIFDLYNQLRDYDFNCDIKDVLPNVGNKIEGMADILQEKFAYTYLVFDFDAHHREIGEETLDIDTVVNNNISKLREMANYFTNETDPGIGRLYINYPMMESFRDCSTYFDENYEDNEILIDDICNYKEIVGRKKLSSVHIEKYSKENLNDLIRMNVFKLNKISLNKWGELLYDKYAALSAPENILEYQVKSIRCNRMVKVINTALFLGLDYFGNKGGFYNSIIGISN